MSFFRFFRSQAASKSPSRAPFHRKARPVCEELERRELPANDIFTVAGAPGSQVSLTFDSLSRKSNFWSEVGVYVVDDLGRVADAFPDDADYAKKALGSKDPEADPSTADTIFNAGQFAGASTTRSFAAGTKLAFYLIQNNTLDKWQEKNPDNVKKTSNQAFFSIDVANKDLTRDGSRADHVKIETLPDGAIRVKWEDTFGLGDKDYNDVIFKISYSEPESTETPGVAGQTITATFKNLAAVTYNKNEMGIFLVDDASGAIGTLSPGSDGYAAAALDPFRKVNGVTAAQALYPQGFKKGSAKTVQLPGKTFFGYYLIQNDSSADFLALNPQNRNEEGKPLAFFSFTAANPDDAQHMKWLSNTKFAFEDSTQGKGKKSTHEFGNFVGTVTMTAPVSTNLAPFVKKAIEDIANAHADQTFDLAGVFDDANLVNSFVTLHTNFGDVKIELFDRLAPQTVSNFFAYINAHLYDNTIFHRSADNDGDSTTATVTGTADQSFSISTTAGGAAVDIGADGAFEFQRYAVTQQLETATGTATTDKLNIPTLDFVVGDLVRFTKDGSLTLPDGITENRIYYVKSVSGDDITVALTSDSNAAVVDITADGDALAEKLALVNGVAATDKLTSVGHTLAVDDLVKFTKIGNEALPGGVTAGTIYFVQSVDGDNFTISATKGGAVLNITSDGKAALQALDLQDTVSGTASNATNLISSTEAEVAVGDAVVFIDTGAGLPAGITEDTVFFVKSVNEDFLNATGITLKVGDKVTFAEIDGKFLPGGIETDKDYFIKSILGNNFTISESANGTAVDITSDGSVTLKKAGKDFVFQGGGFKFAVDQGAAAALADDTITVTGVTFVKDDLVRFVPTGTQDLPAGVTDGKVYFVKSVNGSAITIAETKDGTTIDITAAGSVIAQKLGEGSATKNDDKIVVTGQTFIVGDLVQFRKIGSAALPTGIAEDTVFFVKTVVGNTITISTSAGGDTVDITTDGTAAVQKVALKSITDDDTPTVENEADVAARSNTRGTLAMAKKGGSPDSADSQFFFNIHDSSENLNSQNGGFTVFGRVVDAVNMKRVDDAAAVPSVDFSNAESDNPNLSTFNEMPIRNYTKAEQDLFPDDTVFANFFAITSVTTDSRPEFLTYTVQSSNNDVVEARIDSVFTDRLKLTFKKSGTATITVRATDKSGAFVEESFKITNENRVPVATNDTYSVTEDGTLTRTASLGVLANDTDADSGVNRDTLKAVLVTGPTHGNLHLNDDGSFTYTPDLNFNGTDTFTYKTNDGHQDSVATATATITVTAVNDAPVAQNGTLTTTEDTATTGQLVATDADSTSLTYSVVDTTNAHGTVTITNTTTGAYLYTPAANFNGTASFTFRASDGTSTGNTATITITVTPTNDVPTANADSYSTPKDTPLVVTTTTVPPGVLDNDFDPDGESLTALVVVPPVHGTLDLHLDGSFTYTPEAGFTGGDSFSYKANDGHDDSNTTTVLLTVRADNTAPTVSNAIGDITVTTLTANKTFELAGVFDDADLASSFVRLNTNFGAIDLELYDDDAPRTVSNFYDYITGALYNDVIFHRSADSGGTDFVLQGGGFKFVAQQGAATAVAATDAITVTGVTFKVGDTVRFTAAAGQTLPGGVTEGTVYFVKTVAGDVITISTTSGGTTLDITADGGATANRVALDAIANASTPQVEREPDAVNRPNARGTIAMARSSPDDATSQFYFNLVNNTSLDTQAVPFTVFGKVADAASLARIDAVAARIAQIHPGFGEVPMQNYNEVTGKATDDTITSTGGTTFMVGDQVKFAKVTGQSLPGSIFESTTYFVKTVVGNVITVSLTNGGTTLDISTDGNATIVRVGDPFPGDTIKENFFVINSVDVLSRPETLTYAVVSNTNSAAVSATVDPVFKDRLILDYLAAGVTTITISATDSAGHVTETHFDVTVSS